MQGVDLLVAYPLSSPNLRRLAEITSHAGEQARVSVLCEDAQGVAATPSVLHVYPPRSDMLAPHVMFQS